jgi:hypothetical protein
MTVTAHPALQRQSFSLPAARRPTRALTSPHPEIPLERRPDAKSAHALNRRGWYPSVPSTRLRLTALRYNARKMPAIHKSP